jgi:hypothetical protein
MWSPSQNGNYSGPVTPRIPIPESNGLFVDPGWYGTIVVETEGTNEALADLQDRCGPGAFPPRPQGVNGRQINRDQKKVFRILREKRWELWPPYFVYFLLNCFLQSTRRDLDTSRFGKRTTSVIGPRLLLL